MKIISGGQTGVDRGALDAAIDAGIETGGWVPAGRKAEDGQIPLRYPLKELQSSRYVDRTLRNVQDSDGTLIISFGKPSGGTGKTLEFCLRERRPHLVVDAEKTGHTDAAVLTRQFVDEHAIEVLNVAGPRASGNAGAYTYARTLVQRFLEE